MTNGKETPFASRGKDERWERVAFLTGKLAASVGSAREANPHPLGSLSAQGWFAGWQAHGGEAALSSPRRVRIAVKLSPVPRPIRLESDLTMDMIERLPGMGDDDLRTLGVNAERLALTGTPKQKASAQAVLPAIQAEIAERLAKKIAAAPPKSAATLKRKAAAVAAAVAAAAARPA
jgi:hypothetical protein